MATLNELTAQWQNILQRANHPISYMAGYSSATASERQAWVSSMLSQASELSQQMTQLAPTTATTTPTMPTGAAPVYGEAPTYTEQDYRAPSLKPLPTYNAPEWSDEEVSSMAQKKAAPGLRTLRSQVQRVTGRNFGNNQVMRMTLRDALQGYGQGIEGIMSSAETAGLNQYTQKYGRLADTAKIQHQTAMTGWDVGTKTEQDAAKTTYEAQRGARMANWQASIDTNRQRFQTLWDKWRAGIGSQTITTRG